MSNPNQDRGQSGGQQGQRGTNPNPNPQDRSQPSRQGSDAGGSTPGEAGQSRSTQGSGESGDVRGALEHSLNARLASTHRCYLCRLRGVEPGDVTRRQTHLDENFRHIHDGGH